MKSFKGTVWYNQIANGHAKYRSGVIYNGDFKKDKPEGEGVQVMTDGSYY